MGVDKVHDYVIIGSGAAGSVLAERLSADSRRSVLVVEAGGSDRHPLHRIPASYAATSADSRWSTGYPTQPFGSGTVEDWRSGRVVGGTTTVNGLLWNRGWSDGYEACERAGGPPWAWGRFVEAFRAIEGHDLGTSPVRGGLGPLAVSVAPHDPASDRLVEAMWRRGIPFVDDVNGSGGDRVGYAARSIRRGVRVSAADAFLRRAVRRPNVTLLTGTEVRRITFEGTTATGVEAVASGTVVRLRARREVVTCAGALTSPLLLERSGVGDPDILDKAGIGVVAASPRVGENLRQHRVILMPLRLSGLAGYNVRLNTPLRRLRTTARYLATRRGVPGLGASALMAMYHSDADSVDPDTQAFFVPLSVSASLQVESQPGATFVFYPLNPTSTGYIHVAGPRSEDVPHLVPRYLTSENDRRLMVSAYRRAYEVLGTEPAASTVAAATPGPAMSDEDAILAHALDHGLVGNHAVGTCAIGPDQSDVTDPALRVRGTEGLRVVDASVFPAIPAGNTAAPTMAMAWLAARLLAEGAGPTSSPMPEPLSVGGPRC